jgi:aryl-alcohol dehydrogenase-like predicted oxidoreductase
LRSVAEEKDATSAQIALAWLLAQRPYIVPIPGTTKIHRVEENIKAARIDLTADELRKINEAASRITPAGERYAPRQMSMVGREAPEKAEV